MEKKNGSLLLLLQLLIGVLTTIPTSVGSIGVCYGMLGNNLPPASEVVSLCKSNGIEAMRLYAPDAATLNALKNTDIDLMMGVPDELLPELASNAGAAATWVKDNIVAYPGVSFKYIVVGNEVPANSASNILPAMTKLWDAIHNADLRGKIRVSTAVRFDVFKNTYPPSNAEFSASYMYPIVTFLVKTGNPLFVNVYPFFAYKESYPQISLDYALFIASSALVSDPPYQYQNLFDAMVDSVYYALEKAGGSQVDVVVSESGWPSDGDRKVGTTVENAKTYIQNLIKHVANGTPKRKGNLKTYIFAMFNENQKQGDELEKHFGMFYPDKSPVYDMFEFN